MTVDAYDSDGSGGAFIEEPPRRADRGPDGGRIWRWFTSLLDAKSLTLILIVIVVGYLAITPVAYLLYGTFIDDGGFSLDSFRRAYEFSGIWAMVFNSLIYAVGSALLAFVIGTSLAYVAIRTNVRFKSLLVATALVPLIIPGLLYAIAWIMLSSERIGFINQISTVIIDRPIFNIYSLGGMIWVEGTHIAPLVFLFMAAAFRNMDPSLEESALVCGASRWTMLRRVTIPLVRPAFTGAILLVAVKAIEGFEIPALIGLPTRIYVFTSRIYFEVQNFDFGAAGALSVNLMLISIIGVFGLAKLRGNARDYATVTGKGFRPQTIDLGRAKGPIAAVVLFWFILTAVLPFLVMVYTSFLPYYQKFSFAAFGKFSWANYADLFDNRIFLQSVKNSLVLSFGSATVIMVIVGIAAWLVVRGRMRGRGVVDQLTFLPMVVPGLVMGVALSFVYLRNPLPWQIYGTIWILMIAYSTRFMPYGMRYAVPSLTQISPELEESAHVAGATWWQINRRILIPLMIPGLLAGWIYIVITSIRELSSSLLLYSPSNEVLAILIWIYNDKGELTTVSAIGVLLVLTLIVIVTIAYKLGGRIGLQTD